MKFLTEAQAETMASKIKMAPLTEKQEYAIAKRFAEKQPWSVANFLIGNSSSIKSEFRRFRKEEISTMRFDAWKDATGARWDNQHCRFVIFQPPPEVQDLTSPYTPTTPLRHAIPTDTKHAYC